LRTAVEILGFHVGIFGFKAFLLSYPQRAEPLYLRIKSGTGYPRIFSFRGSLRSVAACILLA